MMVKLITVPLMESDRCDSMGKRSGTPMPKKAAGERISATPVGHTAKVPLRFTSTTLGLWRCKIKAWPLIPLEL